MTTSDTMTLMRNALQAALNPSILDIEDEGYLHHGHAPSAHGMGYFQLIIWSEQFIGCTKVDIHRKIYQALGDLMKTHIHALSIVVQKPTQ